MSSYVTHYFNLNRLVTLTCLILLTLNALMQVEQLVGMGFERARVVEALRQAHNDLNTATSLLLRG